MSDLIRRQDAIDILATMQGRCTSKTALIQNSKIWQQIKDLPSADAVEVVRCYECKHNPKKEWFDCPMAGANERQRPEDAWCWKGER